MGSDVNRSLRVPITAAVLLLGIGGLCAAWYVSTQRAFNAERTLQSQQVVRQAGDRERIVAASLAERLETLRRTESQRPYFHYQNLYHDPKGASQGFSVRCGSGPHDCSTERGSVWSSPCCSCRRSWPGDRRSNCPSFRLTAGVADARGCEAIVHEDEML